VKSREIEPKNNGKMPKGKELLSCIRRNGKKGHPGKAPKPCPLGSPENAEKILEIRVKQTDGLSNSIRDSSRPDELQATTQE
jgi:hypothetical protein